MRYAGSRRVAPVATLCLTLAACGGGPRQSIHDLVEEFPLAEVLQEVSEVDVGTPGARRHLARGWYDDEGGDGGPTFAWSEGDESTIEFVLVEARDVGIELRCRPFVAPGVAGQVVTPFINGDPLPGFSLRPGFASYRVDLPAARLMEGRNRLTFRYRYAVAPREVATGNNDWRRLAVAVDWLRFDAGDNPPQPGVSRAEPALDVPPRSLVAYHFRYLEGLRVEVDQVTSLNGSGRLRLVAVSQTGVTTVLADAAVGDGRVRAEVFGPEGEPFRLELQSIAAVGAGGQGSVVRLVNPRLTAPVGRGRSTAARPPARSLATAGRPNMVIYLVDALRADRLGVYGQPRDLSPELDAFAASATVYERAWAPSSWTRPSVASIFTGLRPEVHGTNGRLDRLGDGMAVLAERFAGAGYATAAVVANPNISAEFGFARGFDSFLLMEPNRRRSTHLDREVEGWLEARDRSRPFLLYVHAVDPHLPYEPSEPFRTRFAPGVERADLGSTAVVGALQARNLLDEDRYVPDLLALYDGEVACNDHSFGLLLEQLERRGLDRDTVVVFLSDHGEEFFDHQGWIHGRTLYREVLQVPLVIRFPAQSEGRRVVVPVQLTDLMPTLLELAGLDPQPGIHGVSLLGPLPPNRAAAAFLNLDDWGGFSVIEGRRHAIRPVDRGYTGPAELYDLELDPLEQEDLGQGRGVEAGAMLSDSRRRVLGEEGRYGGGEAQIDDELRRRLEALGYL